MKAEQWKWSQSRNQRDNKDRARRTERARSIREQNRKSAK